MSKNSSRDWLEKELRAFAATLPSDSMVLDAGAGDQVYAPIFYRQRYESADFVKVDKPYKTPTYQCDLTEIPVDDSRYDAVIFTQVMEHLPDPLSVLKELYRVMKPGAQLFYTGPLWYEEHEIPYDFYRYTRFGLEYMFGRTGLHIREFRGLEGYLGSVAHQLKLMRTQLPWRPADYGGGLQGWASALAFLIFRPFISPLRRAATAADRRFRYEAGGLSINYLAILLKPAKQPGIPTLELK